MIHIIGMLVLMIIAALPPSQSAVVTGRMTLAGIRIDALCANSVRIMSITVEMQPANTMLSAKVAELHTAVQTLIITKARRDMVRRSMLPVTGSSAGAVTFLLLPNPIILHPGVKTATVPRSAGARTAFTQKHETHNTSTVILRPPV